MKQRILFFLVILAALALCLLPALCFGQTVGQFGIPKWTASGTQTQWVTPQNGKVFAISSSGALEMATASGASTFAGLTDVAFTSLVTGQIPRYNSVSGDWENWTLPAFWENGSDTLDLTDSVSGFSIQLVPESPLSGNAVVTIPAAGIVSPSSTNTLTNKTISGATNTISNLSASNVTTGSLALARITQGGATSGQALAWNGSAWAPATIAATPGGSSGQVQYNNGGSFGGVTGLTLTTGTLSAATIAGGTVTSSAPLLSASQTWNAAAVFHAADISVTNTSSSAGSTLQRWRVGGSNVISIASNTAGSSDANPWRLVFDTSGSIGFNPNYSAFTLRDAANTAWAGIFAGGFYSNSGGITSPTYISAGAINGVQGEAQLDTSNNYGPGLRMRNTGLITWTTGTTTTSAADIIIDIGTDSPEAAVTANPGSMYLRNNGGAGELWIKTSGTGNTGWTQVTIP